MNKVTTVGQVKDAAPRSGQRDPGDESAQSLPPAQLLDLFKSVSRILGQGLDQDSTLKAVLDDIAHHGQWPIGHVYFVNETEDALTPTDLWHLDDDGRFEIFRSVTADTFFERGRGMPGKVWDSGQPIWFKNVRPNPSFPRAEAGSKCGIRSGFGFPIAVAGTVIGVMEFFSTTERKPDESLMDCLDIIGGQLGQMITQHRSESIRARQAAALSNIQEAMLIQNSDGVIVDCNDGAVELYGYSRDELIGRESRTLVSPNVDVEALYASVVPEITAKGHWNGDIEIKRKDGALRHIEISSTLLRNKDGVATGWVELNRDVTDRRVLENARRLHSLVMEQLDEAVLIVDLNGIIIECNATTEKILGFGREDLVGVPAVSLMAEGSEDDRRAWREGMVSDLKSQGTVQVENKVRRKDGSVRDVLITYGSLANEAGDEFARVVVAKDITEANQAERDLKLSQTRVEAVITASRAAIWEMDMVEDRTFIGPVLKELSGYGEAFTDDIKEWRNLVHPEDLHIYDSRFENWDGRRKDVDAEYRIVDKHGNIKWVRSRGEMFGDSAGEMVRGIGLGWDITEEKQRAQRQEELEKRLLQSQKMETLGTLSGGIAHDFNNILTPILGYAHLAKADSDGRDDLKTHFEHIIGGAERARELVRRILTFSRHIEPARESVNLQKIVSEVFTLIASSVPPQIEVRVTCEDGDMSVLADTVQIHQAILNLCTNALQAMEEEEGVLLVELSRVELLSRDCDTKRLSTAPGSYICVSVQDSGPGIDPDIADRIFEPFFTTRDVDEGTGLGLSVVHGILEAHGGAIRLDQDFKDGARFELYLPILKDETT